MVNDANEAVTTAEQGQNSTVELANERTEAMLRLQKELLELYDQASRDWLAQLKSEAELWSGLATKLAGTRSVPDAIKSYQRVDIATGGDGRGRRTTTVGRVRNHHAKDQPV